MQVEAICTRNVVSLDGNEPLQRAALLMREHHVGAVVVTALEGGATQVRGIVTDRDLAIEVLARGGDASLVPVHRLVQGLPAGILAQADLGAAVQAMQAAGTRRLLVHDDQGLLVGLLSIDDLLPALVAPLAGLGDLLGFNLQREVQARGRFEPPARPVLRVPAMGTVGWQTQAGG
jgi:CBS domain-containing protein